MNRVGVFEATTEERVWLQELTCELGTYRLDGSAVERQYVDAVRARAASRGVLERFRLACQQTLATEIDSKGYLLVDQLLPDPQNESLFTRAATIMASLLGSPFHMSRKQALWEIIGVDFSKQSYRFGGVGHNPLHIDGVNTTHPPDYLILLCRREDPAGGGASLVSHLQQAVNELNEDDRVFLQQPIFEEGEFYELEGVGQEYRPFPLLSRLPDGIWRVRVTGKMLPSMPPGPVKAVLERLQGILEKNQVTLRLQPGQALIINQLLNAHGRLPLGEGQERIPSSERRDFRQGFVRFDTDSFIPVYDPSDTVSVGVEG
jgi:hypothetical protein